MEKSTTTMVKSHLKSILSKRGNVPQLLQNLLEQPHEWLAVEDENGKLLFGEAKENGAEKFPILQDGEPVGSVSGSSRAAVAATWLSHLVEKENDKKKLGAEALHLYREINLIYNFSEKVATAFNPAAIGRLALEEAGALIKFNGGAVVLWDDEAGASKILAQTGTPFFSQADLHDKAHFAYPLVTDGQAQIIEKQALVVACAALKVKHRVMGSLLLFREAGDVFTAADLKLLVTLAQQSASSIETLLLLEQSVWKTLELEREKMETENVKSLAELKSQFFTNITHEFRTPLTVILGNLEIEKLEIEKLRKLEIEKLGQHNFSISQFLNFLISQNDLTRRNSESLLRLINQLLDLSKMEQGGLQLHLRQGDVAAFLKYVAEPFKSYAAGQGLDFQIHFPADGLVMDFDPDQLSHVLANLLSNAIKFTPSGGQVTLRLAADNAWQAGASTAIICVSDTGRGISAKDLPHIFDRFFQAHHPTLGGQGGGGGGTGIGLAHAQELVKLMGGTIAVESTPGVGTAFTVRLPSTRSATAGWQTPPSPSVWQAPLRPLPADPHSLPDPESPLLLIVEDSPDVVAYLQACLRHIYQIEVAYDGAAGIEKALELVPDIVISDVMMPEKDGFELLETLKNDERTSHVPVVLLTAKADAASKLEGLRRGADAYLPKPFDREELLVRLEQLVELRKRLRAHFQQAVFSENEGAAAPGEAPEPAAAESAFIQKLKSIVAENISDELFGLPELCKKIGMSRSQLFRKMKALSGDSPSGFIRSYRLHRAKEMLRTTDLNISEIGYEIGFKDPAHFSRAFHDAFGMTPSAFRG